MKTKYTINLHELLSNIDLEEAYLGNIDEDRWDVKQESVESIIDRLDTYWKDYFMEDCEEQLNLSFDSFEDLLNYLDDNDACISRYERNVIDVIVHPEKCKLNEGDNNYGSKTRVRNCKQIQKNH